MHCFAECSGDLTSANTANITKFWHSKGFGKHLESKRWGLSAPTVWMSTAVSPVTKFMCTCANHR